KMTGRMAAPRRNSWLAIPLLAAVGLVGWFLISSGRGGPEATDEAGAAARDGDAPETATADTTLAAGTPAKPKPEDAAPEKAVVPPFTKAEGVFGRVLDAHEKGIPGAKVILFAVDPT